MSKRDSDRDSERRRERKRARKSRWGGSELDKAFIPGMPTILPGNLTPSQERTYLLQLQIEDMSRRLRTGDLGINPNPEERSPSPEPIYNNEGKRLNTREYRTRKKLEDDRHSLIQEMMTVNLDYKPPIDYKPPAVRVSDKVMIPQEEHPEINFVGLLIGPRGNTLKSMEKDSGAKIIIRGKGSVKEGKVGRKDGQPLPGEDEPLHAYVTANNPESVKKAVDRIKDILRQGIEVPEGQNDLRRNQLRELALLNGTLRENEGPRCSNCGASTHKSWECPDKPNVTNNIICTSCGGAGHIAKDCREKRTGTLLSGGGMEGDVSGDKAKIDEEYMSLMAELGEGPAPKMTSNSNTNASQVNVLAGNQGPMRALMAPPTAAYAQPWQAPRQVVPAGIPQPTMPAYIAAAAGQPPVTAVGVMYPQWQTQPMPQTPVSQPGLEAATPASSAMTPMMAAPGAMLQQQPPPPPPPGGVAIPTSQQQQQVSSAAIPTSQMSAWVTQQQVMAPWQQTMVNASAAQAPSPVPPPRMAAVPPVTAAGQPAALPPWQQQQFMGLPPPGAVVQPPIPGTVAPPPPPPTVNTSAAPGMDLNAFAGLSGLLTAPPPPPPS